MNRLQLATLLSWVGDGGLKGRKRLQKVVYLLQTAGCPMDCAYTLHHFGPYSRDVADACDEMVAAGLVEETVEPNMAGKQYTYRLKDVVCDLVAAEPETSMMPFRDLGAELMDPAQTHPWWLELGSTILYFLGDGNDWEAAMAQACKFKKVDPTESRNQQALKLAKRLHGKVLN